MNWNRTDANWSELKRKPKKQPESGKAYNINMHKTDLKPQAISIIKPDGFNLKTNPDQSLSSFNKPNVKQGAQQNVPIDGHITGYSFEDGSN